MSLNRFLLPPVVVREVEAVAPAPVQAVPVLVPAQVAVGEFSNNLSEFHVTLTCLDSNCRYTFDPTRSTLR
jgi:hypothetical protein